jgi:ABC-2 type transport system permease protein
MLAILQKELNGFFGSLIAYVIIGFFLLIIGLWMWFFPETNVLDAGYADLQSLFRLGPYVFMFLVPAITMGLLAEERKSGTLEILLTSPITPLQLILGKYLASLVIIVCTLLLTTIYYFSIAYLANPSGNIDTAAVVGSYLGLMLLAATFAGIGIAASSLTESQIIAFLVGVLGCFLLYQGFDAWSTLQTWKSYALLIAQFGLLYHYEALSRGVIDSRDLIYFMSVIVILIAGTRFFLSYKR